MTTQRTDAAPGVRRELLIAIASRARVLMALARESESESAEDHLEATPIDLVLAGDGLERVVCVTAGATEVSVLVARIRRITRLARMPASALSNTAG